MFKPHAAQRIQTESERNQLTLELSEIREISELLFARIDKKLNILEAMELTLDRKIQALERLIARAEALAAPADGMNRPHDILALQKKGMTTTEIAEALGLPVGEVELIANLHVQQERRNCSTGKIFPSATPGTAPARQTNRTGAV